MVPGDLLLVDAGDRVAADARLVESADLRVNESPFTGESLPVEKVTHALGEDTPLHDRRNMIYMGTTVSGGRGVAVVTATGMSTEIGQIAEAIRGATKDKTPLQKAIDKLGHTMIWVVLSACGILFAAGIAQGMPWVDVLLLAVAAAVAAIPEGLPATVTVVLAMCVSGMSKRNVIIRKLTAVETLGTTTVICTDKTGTLTLNQMTVRAIWANRRTFDVSGSGYEPVGGFLHQGTAVTPEAAPELKPLLLAGALCTDAILTRNGPRWSWGSTTSNALP